MAGKLIFYFGTVNSSKTLNLLAIGHNYDTCGWHVCTVKPALDTRSELIETRVHVPPRKADIVISERESFFDYKDIINDADVILIDECQFLSTEQVNELRSIATSRDIDILCFGLRTDFNTNLFPASKRLFELADEITEVKTICSVCGKHASFNAKVKQTSGETCNVHESYLGVNCENNISPSWDAFEQRCWKHFDYRE